MNDKQHNLNSKRWFAVIFWDALIGFVIIWGATYGFPELDSTTIWNFLGGSLIPSVFVINGLFIGYDTWFKVKNKKLSE